MQFTKNFFNATCTRIWHTLRHIFEKKLNDMKKILKKIRCQGIIGKESWFDEIMRIEAQILLAKTNHCVCMRDGPCS